MSFWEDFLALRQQTPRVNLQVSNNENCGFTNYWTRSKNCYMCAGGYNNEDCYYCTWMHYNNDCTDCNNVDKSQLCYETVDSLECYNCNFCQNCRTSSDLEFCFDCTGCKNCFGCAGLQHKENYIFNQPCPPEQYRTIVQKLRKEKPAILLKRLEELRRKIPQRQDFNVNCEKCSGNYIQQSKNCLYCFDTTNCEDCCYIGFGADTKDGYDLEWTGGNSEASYNSVSVFHAYNINCSYVCWDGSDLEYCELCFNCKDCFGCVSLHGKQYHILNQPYSREDYLRKVAEIKAELRAEKRYGQLPPPVYPVEDTKLEDFYPKQ